ncbi:hypothetical protein MMC10_009147 [Thelotrema lepadinum]|nr:hypothetical protein [Thelotrema lepadinum]
MPAKALLFLLLQCALQFSLVVASPFLARDLRSRLSLNTSVSHNSSIAPRWSEYDAPTPGTVVNVATEDDVLVTVSSIRSTKLSQKHMLIFLKVQYCIANNITFLAQNGGHGWGNTFDLHQDGLLINLAKLNGVDVNSNKTQATIQGGALISDTIRAANANGVQIQTGNCNCVGTLGAILGGGYGNLVGVIGLGVDNLLSLNVVTAEGKLLTIGPEDEDLWWAMRGAGPNFGIVTSAIVKAYAVTPEQNKAWIGSLVFPEDKLETLVQAINDLTLKPNMDIFLYYSTNGTSNSSVPGAPQISVTPFYYGNESAGKEAFAPIYAVGPSSENTSEVSYINWNEEADTFCIKGDRKPAYGAAMAHMVPSTWKAVWDEFVEFVKTSGTGSSIVILEAYSLIKARSVTANSSSFPFRNNVNFNAAAIPWYADSSLDGKAEAFASKARELWRATDGLAAHST